MHIRANVHEIASSRRDSHAMAAIAWFALALLAAAFTVLLVLVRHAHVSPSGGGYWTDMFGFRAGVDNIGVETVGSLLLNWHLHWQHNAIEFAAIVVAGVAYVRGRARRAASKRAPA